jgi:phosphate transport system permease protein
MPAVASAPLFDDRLQGRKTRGVVVAGVLFTATLLGIIVLLTLLVQVLVQGLPWLTLDFLRATPVAADAARTGIWPAILGSLFLMLLTAAFAVPVGVGAAIWLEEYAYRGWLTRLIQININNLAGIPSVVYGILGLGVFVYAMRLGNSVVSAALTMALLVLPIIVISSQEAIRAIPLGLRESAFALGATRSQVIFSHVLPAALPGILTGIILGLSRAVGETAPLVLVGASLAISFGPQHLLDEFTALPMLIFLWTEEPGADFQAVAAAAILVLMAFILLMNFSAILLRDHFERSRPH